MKSYKMMMVVGLVLASAGMVFGAGGVLPDGQGTNWSYGDINGQGTYYLRNFFTANVDGSGITNIPGAGIVSLDASKLVAGSQISAVDLGNATNVPAGNLTGTVGDARLSAALQALAANNGGALTGVVAALPSDGLSTNATEQSKAGKLTLNGGLAVEGVLSLGVSAVQTIAAGAAIAADAANVKVVGDGGAVTATVAAGTLDGQALTIRGTSDANAVTLTNAATVPTFKLGLNDVISYTFVKDTVATNWVEVYRRDN